MSETTSRTDAQRASCCEAIEGYCCQLDEFASPIWLKKGWNQDASGSFEIGERINGRYCCPQCHLWWPCVEQPDMWTESVLESCVYVADGWWGGAVCMECDLLMVDQPDGVSEAYYIGPDEDEIDE